LTILLFTFQFTDAQIIEKVANGIWKITCGTTEKLLPANFKNPPAVQAFNKLQQVSSPPIGVKDIHFS
jgi:hypothetical protein